MVRLVLGLCLLPVFSLASNSLEGFTEDHQEDSLKLNTDGYHSLNFEVYVKDEDNLVKRSLYKRDKLVLIGIDNLVLAYMATLNVGSSKEAVQVQIDTGSSDLWIPTPDVQCSFGTLKRTDLEDYWELQEPDPITERSGTEPVSPVSLFGRDKDSASSETNQCLGGGSYDPGKSSTWELNSTAPPFTISYADGNGAEGVWGTDSLTFGDTTIQGFAIASVTLSGTQSGLLGIGMEVGEASFPDGYSYYNFPETLVLSGYIHTNVFSLYLGSPDDYGSQLLFGAVDHAKYTGELVSLPIVISDTSLSFPTYFSVELDSVQLSLQSNYTDLGDGPWTCVLDCGASYTHVPPDLLASIAQSVGATLSQADGNYYLECTKDTEYSISFVFGQQVIDVPLANLQIPPQKGETLCGLAIFEQAVPYPDISLGDNFLQYAYAVYDAANSVLSLAQAKFTNDSDIEVITSTIPTASGSLRFSNTLKSLSTQDTALYSYLGKIASQDFNSIPTAIPDGFSLPVPTYGGIGSDATSSPRAGSSKAGVGQSFTGAGNTHNTPTGAASTGSPSAEPGNSHNTLTGAASTSAGSTGAGVTAGPSGVSTSIATIEGHPKKNVAASAGVSTIFGILGIILALV